jgi:uncharacterized membrane protein
MLKTIAKRELFHAQIALLLAIGLQVLVWKINYQLAFIPEYIILAEIIMAILIGFTANVHKLKAKEVHHFAAIALIALISVANITSLIFVLDSLIFGHNVISGTELLSSAVAIFITNIIVFALWYWEIDSPGLTRTKWSKHDKDFQFTQQEISREFPNWQPEFIDYVYLSITNAINFAPADTKPLTRSAKLLMACQALISVFTLALLIARSVSILG